jgi:hypothetical protein
MVVRCELVKAVEVKGFNVVATVDFIDTDSGQVLERQEIPGNDLTPDALAARCQVVCEAMEACRAALASFANVRPGQIALPRDKG